jgi:HAE1 family hydrophobic/amphiphilic exporter-1
VTLTLLLLPVRVLLALFLGLAAGAWIVFSKLFSVAAWPFTRLLAAIGSVYPRTLRWALRLRWLVLACGAALLAVSLLRIGSLGTDLVPDLAQGEFAFRIELPEGTPLETTAGIVERIESRLVGDPNLEEVFAVIGNLPSSSSGRRAIGENLARLDVTLPAGSDAEDEARAVARVRDTLGLFEDVDAELVRSSVLTLQPPVEVDLFSDDLARLDEASKALVARLEALPSVRDVASTAEPGSPEIRVELDRERAAALGISAADAGAALRRQIHGEIVGTFREEAERLDIRVRAGPRWRERASEIRELRVRLPGGTSVPISSFADVEISRGPAAIHRIGGARVAQISAETVGGDLGHVLEQVRAEIRAAGLGEDVVAELAGQNEELDVSFGSLRLALVLALFLVYVVMAIQFESLRHPFVILLSVPLGLIGVIGALWVTGTAITVLALIGVVMLAGIVVNNAIVLVDAINRRRRSGQDLQAAIVGAGEERLRPILMTTTTTVLALLPMAVGWGAGSELRAPLAITVIGGLLVSTILTLVVIPSLYRIAAGGASR